MKNRLGQTAVLITTILLLLTACTQQSSVSETPSLPGSDLDGSTWTMTSMAKTTPEPGSEITAGFMGGQVSGSTGCNNYFSAYTTEGERIMLEGAGVTEMACMTPDGVMEQESRFLAYLNQVERFHLSADELQLITADGEYLIFAPRP